MDTTTLILDCAPFVPAPTQGSTPDAVYQIFDTDGDVPTDVAFNVTFTPLEAEGGPHNDLLTEFP